LAKTDKHIQEGLREQAKKKRKQQSKKNRRKQRKH
jgi:hypothetical protein